MPGLSVSNLQEQIDGAERDLKAMKLFMRNARKTLSAIEDIVGVGWFWYRSDEWSYVTLSYRGEAKNEEQAKKDLARIMRALKCIFEDQEYTQYGDHGPQGYYEATARIGRLTRAIRLEVPWLPAGCEVRREHRRHWSTETSFSVSCRR